jgi:hypothetical protein
MKKILVLLSFVIVAAMGGSDCEIGENLSQEERFEMLFGETSLQFHEIRQSRKSRTTRNDREIKSNRLVSEDKVIELSSLTQNEKYELLFGNTMPTARVARTSRFIFPRQARQSLYVSLNY